MKTYQNKKKKKVKKSTLRRYMQKKLTFLFIAIALALLLLIGVLVNIVNGQGADYKQTVMEQQNYKSIDLPYRRGSIIDRNGTYLAVSQRVYRLILEPKVILSDEEKYKEQTLSALVEFFGLDRTELEEKLDTRKNSYYEPIADLISYEDMEAFLAYKSEVHKKNDEAKKENEDVTISPRIHGIWFEEKYQRTYPYDSLGSHVIGFTNSDGSMAIGGGIEQQYDGILSGINGREYGYVNLDAVLERSVVSPENGNTVMSTIDVKIQGILEKNIQEYYDSPGAQNIAVFAMNPNNGEILGMAYNKGFNLNNPYNLSGYLPDSDIEAMSEEDKMDERYKIWRNFCISDTFEPGSTVKVFTIASALEEGTESPNSSFYCNGAVHISGWPKPIKCNNRNGHQTLSLQESLMKSCNVAMMQIAEKVGRKKFAEYQRLFGFGERTGVDLPGEARGILHNVEDMGPTDLATNSFGQNFTVTMVQVAAGYASLINGGSYYEPHTVKKILDDKGSVVKNIEPNLVRETVSQSTSEFLKTALFQTVESGTATIAYIEGYEIAGKTGTAEKIPRDKKNYLVSFCGFAPYDDPQVLVYVVIDQPNEERQDSASYATRIFHGIMEELLPYLNVFPLMDPPAEPLSEEGEEENTDTPVESQAESVIDPSSENIEDEDTPFPENLPSEED